MINTKEKQRIYDQKKYQKKKGYYKELSKRKWILSKERTKYLKTIPPEQLIQIIENKDNFIVNTL